MPIRVVADMIRCESLSKSFGGTRALDNFSFEFAARGITAIIGPNGAGKTTLINVLSGFLKPDRGRWFLDEIELTSMPAFQIARKGVGRTFQDLRLIQRMTVLENLLLAAPETTAQSLSDLFGLSPWLRQSENIEACKRILDQVGLTEKAQELSGNLSYGQQKLLTLACCLATQPSIILLDEPLSGIHPNLGGQIMRLMVEIGRSRTVVFIEHDIESVREVADSVVVMDDGRLLLSGPPAEVLSNDIVAEAFIA